MTNPQVRSSITTSGDAFARTLLSAATEVEAAETAIKAELLRAARAGDCNRVIDLVARWQDGPAVEVLKAPTTTPKALDPCGTMSVPVTPSRPTSAREV